MELPENWTGTSGHVLTEPWIDPVVRDGFAELITELEEVAPEGLAHTRTAFRQQGQIDHVAGDAEVLTQEEAGALDQLLNLRFELLAASQLARAGALTRIRKDTPDFECRSGSHVFGVEVTTRAREEVAAALHNAMERGLWDGPDVNVVLERTTGALLFSENPCKLAETSNKVIAQIRAAVTAQSGANPGFGSVPVPELGLTAVWHSGTGLSAPGMRVTYDSVLLFTPEQWTHHWTMATKQIQDTIVRKGCKEYSLPSIAVVDVSRLGETSRLLSGEAEAKYQAVLDDCDLDDLFQGVSDRRPGAIA